MGRIGTASAVAALTLAVVVPAGAQAAPVRPALAGTTTVTGSRTASIQVRLDRSAVLRDPLAQVGGSSDVVVSGGTGFAGFVLRSDDGKHVYAGGRLSTGPAAKRTFVLPVGPEGGNTGEWTLPKGGYRLYLLTGGGATKVTFRLGGLRGSTRFTPSSPRKLTVQTPTPQLEAPAPVPTKSAYSVGGDTTVTGPTLAWSFLYHVHDVHTESDYWSCTFKGKPSRPAPYTPGCLGGSQYDYGSHLLYSDEYVGREIRYLMSSYQPLPAGQVGQGVWLATVTPATEIGYIHFWLTY